MNPLSVLYGVASGARNILYERGVLRPQRLEGPVVSIGNVSVGGSGKTPFVIALGELLKAHGIPFDVLSRGYGRSTTGVLEVQPSGTAAEFGDEPLLIARRLDVPVVVGESRFAAGEFAEKRWGPRIHLLDDGFQHRALYREVDILLVSAADQRDRLLPVGRLREPWTALGRAHVIAITNESPSALRLPPGKVVWRLRRGLTLQRRPARPVVFCGIARPDSFIEQLRALGVSPAAQLFFEDHHTYTSGDIGRLLETKSQVSADGYITTEKDLVNLGSLAESLEPIEAAAVTMEIEDPEGAIRLILNRTNQGGACHEKI